VAYGVDPAMKAVQTARADPVRDHVLGKTACTELGEREHAPLLRGETRDAVVDFLGYMPRNSNGGGHDADGPSPDVTPLRVIATALPQIAYMDSTKTSVARPK
jgi:hypothetical protein